VLSLTIWDIESSARLEHDFRASVQRHVVWFLASFFINCLFYLLLNKMRSSYAAARLLLWDGPGQRSDDRATSACC
jgi:hypothetical protein